MYPKIFEAVQVFCEYDFKESTLKRYPFIRWFTTEGREGAGAARNVGIEAAHRFTKIELALNSREALDRFIARLAVFLVSLCGVAIAAVGIFSH